MLPVTFAILLNFLLSPAVRILARLRIPVPVGAGLVVLTLVGRLGLGAYRLAAPVENWAERAPRTVATARRELGKLAKPFERVTRTAREVETVAFAGLDTYQSLGRALLPPAVFLLINALQANLLYPILQARRLALNPVAVFLGLAFWFWIWGVPGAFIAVPVLAAFKICCDNIEGLAPIGEFLGAREETPLP